MESGLPVALSVRHKWVRAVLLSFLALCGCGGGSGGNSGQPPPPPVGDFSLAVTPSSILIPAGGSAGVSLKAAASNGFSSQVSVQLSGLPTGVQASPASVVLTPGTAQTVTLNVASGTSQGTTTATFTGSSSTLQHTATLGLSITLGGNGMLPTRTKYVRTDAVTEYYLWVNSHWTVYHVPTAHFFVTDPFSNQVIVMDPATRTRIATIAVPGAYGIDQTPDSSTLYVGTLIGDIYAIDPVTMAVKHRYIASQIGPYGFQAITALVLADGRLALLGAQGGIPSVDGSTSAAIWNPNDNSITIYGAPPKSGIPTSPLCGNTVTLSLFQFMLTTDRTSLITNALVNGLAGLCELNASTGQSIATNPAGTGKFIVSPDGKYIAIPVFPDSVELIDQKTLKQVAQFKVTSDNLSDAAVIFSPDSKTLFVSGSSFVNAYDVASQQWLGWIPEIVVSYTSGGDGVGPPFNPIYGAFDTTGLMVGPLEEGFGFLDTTQLHTGPTGLGFLNAVLNPDTGPVTGATVTQWSAPLPSQVYFGKNLASFEPLTGDLLSVITPPGQPGPADVYLFLSDGEMQLIPEGYSYGPTILEVSPNAATAEGGAKGVIYGYGFAPDNSTAMPPGLTVAVGGQPATVTAFNPNSYNQSSPAPPFPLQSIYFTIPAGTAVGRVDISVTTSSGTTTANAALSYLPAMKQFSLAGAALVQGIYDPIRDVYYFTDANKIQVFSLAQEKWLSPIPIPAPAGTTQRLWGIALSPDGSKLAIADTAAAVIYLVNPASPSSVKTFSMNGVPIVPAPVAISDSGMAYLAVNCQCGFGYSNFYKLDTNSGILTNLNPSNIGSGAPYPQLRTVISSDNSRVYFNVEGYVAGYDTSTGTMFSASAEQVCCYDDDDLTLAPNQRQVGGSSYLYDSSLNATSTLALNDRETMDISYVYGIKFSPDGSLLFQPATHGIDIYDGRVGTLRSRVALSVPLSTNYDALVSDGKDNILLAITGTGGDGIAVVDLSSVTEPPPLPYAADAGISPMSFNQSGFRAGGSASSQSKNNQRSENRRRVIPHVTNPNLSGLH